MEAAVNRGLGTYTGRRRAIVQVVRRQVAVRRLGLVPAELEELYSLEYSEHSAARGKFPWHVARIARAVRENVEDLFQERRGPNKWQIVFVGTQEECQRALKEFSEELERRALHAGTGYPLEGLPGWLENGVLPMLVGRRKYGRLV